VVLAGREDRRTKLPDGKGRRTLDAVVDPIPQELHRRLRLYCVTHYIVLMHFVVAATEEKLGRKRGSKKRTT
jgi:hypothetical protein